MKELETLYKLTDANRHTYGKFEWRVGKRFSLPVAANPRLCAPGVFHAYRDLDLGLLLNPIHANVQNPRAFIATGIVVAEDWSKVGCRSLTLKREVPLPQWYMDSAKHRRVGIRFAVLCAEAVVHIFEQTYPNDGRPRAAIKAALAYLKIPSDAATHAADAAYAAATHAADAAYAAAYAAADATAAAADATPLDFVALARQAGKEES